VVGAPEGAGRDARFAPEFSQFLEEDNLTEAIRLAETYKKSHVARVLGGALSEVKPLIMDGSVTVADINSAERAVEREMLMTIVDLKRGLGVLATVGATAPFVGLPRHHDGHRERLHGHGASGSGGLPRSRPASPRRSSPPRSASWSPSRRCGAYNYFSTKIDNLTAEMTYTSKEMIDYLIKGVSGEFGRSRFTREFSTGSGTGPISQ
jgi:biopolymer transport protein ExbB/biopolymer transport protein TolQ